ncbi:hypothetical protein [Kocuria sp.]|uniref:hypothetical protein n=1 Tax=Kocuria sp. TaxID=1871328 RepID=UPI0026DFBA7E|nr:hypothetical protein [Kocuria sp.]MDO5619610.1 hypothetical protein [Kocuria sp.]
MSPLSGADALPGPDRADRYSWLALFTRAGVVVVGLALAAILVSYLLGHETTRVTVDASWVVFDHSIERMWTFALVIPLVVAYVAYRVFASDRWWKRAQWALDASVSESAAHRALGRAALNELSSMRLTPREDIGLFSALLTIGLEATMVDSFHNDPESGADA